jgi:hypothetical protein
VDQFGVEGMGRVGRAGFGARLEGLADYGNICFYDCKFAYAGEAVDVDN